MSAEYYETMMGWPLGWTDLKPLETVNASGKRPLHGGF